MVNRVTYHTTPLGRVMLAAKDDALAGLWMEGQKYFADTLKGEAREQDDFPVFVQGQGMARSVFCRRETSHSRVEGLSRQEVNSGRLYGKPSARFLMAKS